MTQARLSAANGAGQLCLEGELGFGSIRALWQQAGSLLPRNHPVSVDLAGVTRADSAGVALLIHWTREQQRLGGRIEFVNIPAQMQAIAGVSGVDAILPLVSPGGADSGPS